MNNKIIFSVACTGLLGSNMLNGELTYEKTLWSGTHLNYKDISIINIPKLPQPGVEKKEGNNYNIMPGKVTVITKLSKNPQEKTEWLYKGIAEVRISMTGDIEKALIFHETTNDIPFNYNNDMFGKSGTLYSQVYIHAEHKITKEKNNKDFGTSGKDSDPTFTLVKKI